MLLDYGFGGEKIKKTVWAENPYTKYYLSGAEFKEGNVKEAEKIHNSESGAHIVPAKPKIDEIE